MVRKQQVPAPVTAYVLLEAFVARSALIQMHFAGDRKMRAHQWMGRVVSPAALGIHPVPAPIHLAPGSTA